MKFKLKNPIKDTLFTEENIVSVCSCLRKLKKIVINGITVIITDTDSNRTISIIHSFSSEYGSYIYTTITFGDIIQELPK